MKSFVHNVAWFRWTRQYIRGKGIIKFLAFNSTTSEIRVNLSYDSWNIGISKIICKGLDDELNIRM